jgi:hypothetical protein
MDYSEELKNWPKTGKLCSICKNPQYMTPGGEACVEGHGGAPPLEEYCVEPDEQLHSSLSSDEDGIPFKEISECINTHVDLITITPEGLAESRERAAMFLVAQALLTSYLKQVDENIAKLSALKDATFAQAIGKTEGKNVTEKKIKVGRDNQYRDMLLKYENMNALREWIKGHIKVFENAHILYRGFCRE